MTKEEQLNELFSAWREKHKAKGYENFISDGIIDYNAWENQTTPKVCYFLKEAYIKDKPFEALDEELAASLWGIWKNKIPFWTQGIYDAKISPKAFEPKMSDEDKRKIINQIAVVNIKKSNGNPKSDGNDLMRYVHEDKDELHQEISVINPDIIVCGGNFHLVREVFDGLVMLPTGDAKWGKTLIIDYYHPSNWNGIAGKTEIHYYALREICRSDLAYL